MKKSLLLLMLLIQFIGFAQTRYFEFSSNTGNYPNWRDSTFIAATSNQVVIDTVLANLAKPFNERKFISGPIQLGSGNVNRNSTHWFSWHFTFNQWNLTDFASTICSGLPYTQVDSNVNYWVNTIGNYCPWSYRPVREVQNPLLSNDLFNLEYEVLLYPNPSKDFVLLKWNTDIETLKVTIFNTLGKSIINTSLNKQNNKIDISQLDSGFYLVEIEGINNQKTVKKLIVKNKQFRK